MLKPYSVFLVNRVIDSSLFLELRDIFSAKTFVTTDNLVAETTRRFESYIILSIPLPPLPLMQ